MVVLLLEAGIRQMVVCPGSRNAPLLYALAEAPALETLVRIDERSAAFTALGLALASGLPTPVITTSGTAAGNLLPAVMEAHHVGAPLVVITADRPEELRGTGANQTTDQVDLFGSHVRFAADCAAGEDPRPALQTALDAARGLLRGVPAGPVHLNLAFRDPLVPAVGEPPTPYAEVHLSNQLSSEQVSRASAPAADREVLDSLEVLPLRRSVVIAGHDAGPLAEQFARDLGLPLLAEPSSGARFGPNAIGPYRMALASASGLIDRVIVFGRPTLSRPVAGLLAATGLRGASALYLPTPVAWFEPGKRREQIFTGPESLRSLVEFAGRGEAGWLEQWQIWALAAESAIESAQEGFADSGLTGLDVARAVWKHTDGQLFLGSSNPIRDVDLVGRPRTESPRVFANRGLAGIDGSVSTAEGVALGSGALAEGHMSAGQVTRALLGDLTFLHESGGLLLPRGERVPDLQLVVLNDAGGGIFSLLEHGALGEQDAYRQTVERFFGTAQDADLAAIAAGYGVRHLLVTTQAELDEALTAPIQGRSLLEVRTERSALRPLHARISEAVPAFS